MTETKRLTAAERAAIARTAAEKRWGHGVERAPKTPKATHVGNIKLFDIEIPCAVLEDGRRVLSQDGMLRTLGRSARPDGTLKTSEDDLPPFLRAKNLAPYISDELRQKCRPFKYRPLTGGTGERLAWAYSAEILAEICEVFLRARDGGSIVKSQEKTVEQCDVLMRGLARTGIVALVDEVTGYQKERERDELQRILERYVAAELLPWARRFPNEFFDEMFRLRGWKRIGTGVQGPQYAGKLVNQLIYKRLPPGVLEELKRTVPGHARLHQGLSPDVGHPHLTSQIMVCTAMMRGATDWKAFEESYKRAYPPPAPAASDESKPAPDEDE